MNFLIPNRYPYHSWFWFYAWIKLHPLLSLVHHRICRQGSRDVTYKETAALHILIKDWSPSTLTKLAMQGRSRENVLMWMQKRVLEPKGTEDSCLLHHFSGFPSFKSEDGKFTNSKDPFWNKRYSIISSKIHCNSYFMNEE